MATKHGNAEGVLCFVPKCALTLAREDGLHRHLESKHKGDLPMTKEEWKLPLRQFKSVIGGYMAELHPLIRSSFYDVKVARKGDRNGNGNVMQTQKDAKIVASALSNASKTDVRRPKRKAIQTEEVQNGTPRADRTGLSTTVDGYNDPSTSADSLQGFKTDNVHNVAYRVKRTFTRTFTNSTDYGNSSGGNVTTLSTLHSRFVEFASQEISEATVSV